MKENDDPALGVSSDPTCIPGVTCIAGLLIPSKLKAVLTCARLWSWDYIRTRGALEYGVASRREGVYIIRSTHSGKVNRSKNWTKKQGQQLERSNLISESLPEAS